MEGGNGFSGRAILHPYLTLALCNACFFRSYSIALAQMIEIRFRFRERHLLIRLPYNGIASEERGYQ